LLHWSALAPLLPSAIQEAAPAQGGWDLVYVCYGWGWPATAYLFFLVGEVIVALIIAARVCGHVGFFPPWRFHLYDELFEFLKKRDFSAVSERAKALAASGPEKGLRSLSILPTPASPFAVLSTMKMADAEFRKILQSLVKEANALATMFGLTTLLIPAIILVGASNALREVKSQKVTPSLYVFAWAIDEAIWFVLSGFLVLMLLFVLRRHMLKRIEERRIGWEFFFNRVMALEYMIGAEKQGGKASNQL